MKNLSWHQTKISYAVEMSKDDFRSIMDYDDESFEKDYPSLFDMLLKIEGIEEVEYDGHFGPYLYLDISADASIEAVKQRVNDVLSLIF